MTAWLCLAAVEFGFSEQDYAVNEDAGSLEILLTVIGLREEDVGITLEITPMTIGGYLNKTGAFPRGVDMETDPAEPGIGMCTHGQCQQRWGFKLETSGIGRINEALDYSIVL